MAPPVSPLWRLAAVMSTLAAASVALEVGFTDQQRDSPKRSRSLLQEEGTGDTSRIKKRMIDMPVELCDSCPRIYGWSQEGDNGAAELSINSRSSSAPIGDPAPTWVVVMNKLAGCEPSRLCEEAAATGKGRFSGECSETYGTVIRGMAIKMDLPNMAAFSESAKECVQEVWRDAQVSIQATQRSPPWGLDRIDQAELPLSDSYTFTAHGTGVNAYIIDTGIMASHHQFQYQDGSPGTRVRNTYSGFEDDDATDCHGHGTHVAATLGGLTFGVAKNVTLHAIRVLDCQGNAQYSRVIKALDHLANTHLSPAVAVLSLGGEPYNALDIAVQAMVESGISVSVAAGNDKRDACLQSPARVRSVITVAGTTSSDTMYWNSNYGKCVDLFAPGVNILSAVHTSNTATGYMTGTSMSAPFVAGAAALFLEKNPGALPYIVKHALVTSAATGMVVNTLGAPNKMLSTKVFAPVMFDPPEFRITDDSPSASYWVSITLAKRPASTVRMDVDRDSMSRGTMQITSLVFEPSTWDQPQYFVFEPSDSSPRGESFNIEFDIESSDPEFRSLQTFFQVTDDREKLGETKEYPVQITSLPFLDSRDTRQYTHVYNHDCSEWGDTGDGPDFVYKYRPESDVVLDINLCESDYDSKVYLYRNEEEEAYACNDDRCGYQSNLRVKLTAGDDFYIIVDGYSGDSGKFILEIKAITGIDPLKLPPGEVDESVNPLPDIDDTESSNDVEMLALSLTNCELSPAFSPAQTSYACRIPPGEPEVTVTYVTANLLSMVEVSNDSLKRRLSSRRLLDELSADVASYKRVELRPGLNIVRVLVLSPDFQRERAYQIEVTLLSDIRETWLQSLQFYNGAHDGAILTMAPPFAFDRMEYVLSVPGKGGADLIWVETEPLSTNSRVTVAVEGQRLKGDSSRVLSGAIALRRRSDIAVVVTAPDGETVSSYEIQIIPEFHQGAPAVDCSTSGFGDWEQCSRECGGGVQLRRRTVRVPASGSGAPCGPLVEEQPCNERPCQTDCSVSPFGDWSGCSARCGAGVQTRTRYVLDVPAGGGVTCPALMEEQFCEVPPELCYQDTDCVLGAWGDWGPCSALCNGGTQTRSRPIRVPKVGNGRSCSVTEESRRCNVQPCRSQCEVTSWGRWEACDSACGPGAQYRRRTVVGVPSDGTSSSGCPSLSESRPCENPPCSQGQDPYPEGSPPPSDLLSPGGPTTPSWSLDSIEDVQTVDTGPLPEAAPVPRYRWVIYGFDTCSSSCGGGTQQRTVQCARISGGGWEIESPGVCEEEGAGKMPVTSRACNIQECAQPALLTSPWQPCSAACDGGIQERAVSCKGTLGMLLPRSSCLDRRARTWQTCATEPCSSAGRPTWVLGPWDKCPVSCGGGVMSREAQCMDRAAALRLGAEMEEVPEELCGVLGRDQPLEAPCNSRPCRVGVWKVGQWDEGSCGSSCASQGAQRTRPVICVALDDDRQDQIDDQECLMSGAPKPASTAPCGSDCTGCGPSGDCFGNGACESVGGRGSVCSCSPGFSGEFCEVPVSCLSGVIDAQIRCCPGPADATTGACCSAGSVTDSRGACCSTGAIDACGVCDGPAISVDVTGTCCPSVLDASGLCCLSGALDECGICDGDGSACDTLLDLTFSLDGVLDVNAVLRQATDARAQVESFVLQRLIPSSLNGRQEGTVVVEKLYSYYTGQDLGINSDAAAGSGMPGAPMRLHGAVVTGDSVDLSAAKPPALLKAPPKPRRRLHEQDDEGEENEGMQQQTRTMVAVTDAWLDNDQELMSATVRVSGLLLGDGSPVSAARSASVLKDQVSPRPTQQASGTLELVGISLVERRAVCGNGYCEVGERPLAAGGVTAALRDSYGDALNPCPADCPVELRACRSPTDSSDPLAMCGGAGKCLHASGVCECFEGYTGDDCGSCSPGFYRTPTGRCTPTATRLAGASVTISGPISKAMDTTMVMFVSIGAVIIGVCIGIIAAALIYLHCKRKRASGASGAQQEQKYPSAAIQRDVQRREPHRQPPSLESGGTPPLHSGCKRPRSPMSTPQSTVGVLHGTAEPPSPGFSTPAVTVRHQQHSNLQQEHDDMSYYTCPPTMMTQSEGVGAEAVNRSLSYENSDQV